MEQEQQPQTRNFYSEKLKRAIHILLFRHGKMPGARGWELKEKLGKNYEHVLSQLNTLLSELDLEVTRVSDRRSENISTEPTSPTEDTRYLITLKGTLGLPEARMIGWRIDNLAALAASLAYIVSKQGKTPRQDVEILLARKFGRWKAATLIDIFLRSAYLAEDDDDGTISLGWRTRAEVDLRTLMTRMVGKL